MGEGGGVGGGDDKNVQDSSLRALRRVVKAL